MKKLLLAIAMLSTGAAFATDTPKNITLSITNNTNFTLVSSIIASVGEYNEKTCGSPTCVIIPTTGSSTGLFTAPIATGLFKKNIFITKIPRNKKTKKSAVDFSTKELVKKAQTFNNLSSTFKVFVQVNDTGVQIKDIKKNTLLDLKF
ncbi:hypothetical protein CVU75_01345 [Candidatus Dependentiae bacterium HGW-Dependentiae-1]|nr:MAG: hypothetical protein CVU75_01345 [Candidatus Dependentiae bacterium HGW-Dependentiae-1]